MTEEKTKRGRKRGDKVKIYEKMLEIRALKFDAKNPNKLYRCDARLPIFIKITPLGELAYYYIYKSPISKKQIWWKIGSFSTHTLKEIREIVAIYEIERSKGIDPKQNFNANLQKQIDEANSLFENIFAEYADKIWLHSEKPLGESKLKQKQREFASHILPFIGKKPISRVTIAHLSDILERRYRTSPSLAKRDGQELKKLFSWAYSKGYIDDIQNASIVSWNYKHLIPQKETKHHPAVIKDAEFKALCRAIYAHNCNPTVKNALKFALHMPLREQNIIGLRWEWVEFENNKITIPRQMLKNKKSVFPDFMLPLSDELAKILKSQKAYCDEFCQNSEFVFPARSAKGTQSGFLPHDALNRELAKMGYKGKQTTHGFRSCLSTIAKSHIREHGVNIVMINLALDHRIESEQDQAYDSGLVPFDEFKHLFNWWSEYILRNL